MSALFLGMGELWFRLPWTTKILLYEFDEERNYRLVGPQSRGLALGNYSVVSPPISINPDGFRNSEIDWTNPTILAVGSSQVLGPGVEDHEVWTAIVSDQLSRASRRPVAVVNAGTPGYGPYHQAITVRKYLKRYPVPTLLVVRAAVSDRAFRRPTSEQLETLRQHMDTSARVRRWSEFVPFLVNKLGAQVAALRESFALTPATKTNSQDDEHPSAADEMWDAEHQNWNEIVNLASKVGTPVLIFVDGADGSPSALRLKELFDRQFGARDDVKVALLGAREAGIDESDKERRRQQYRDRFLLGYDPHANVHMHRVTAQFVTPLVWGTIAARAGGQAVSYGWAVDSDRPRIANASAVGKR